MVKIHFKAITFFIVLICLLYFYHTDDMNTINTFVAVDKSSSLLKKIEAEADKYKEKPEDAYIDKVWKKTPGRDGKKVNIHKSYENMQEKNKFNEKRLVFDTIPPKISIDDLPPAPIYRGHPKKPMTALLINVSWGEEHIPSILKTLKEQNVKAIFFIEGRWAKENKNILKMIDEQGHLIGNHGFNHPDMAKMTDQQIREQIIETNDIIEAIIEKKPQWFAPPSGSYNNNVVKIADQEGLETILWTVDTIDWQKPSVSVMINRVMGNIHQGATVLMHPTTSVAQGLEQLIIEIKNQDLKIHTIEELLKETR